MTWTSWTGCSLIRLVALLVIGAIVTVYKMIHSLFVRVTSGEPGRSLSSEEAPGLRSLTHEVAEKLGTRPLDAIRVAPGTEMAVYEMGSYWDRRKGLGRRTLVMGLGLLPGFDQNPLRAVLAHEYGHLAHSDTADGDVALRVNQDMRKFAYAMAHAGQAVWWSVACQFLRLYHFLFRRISYPHHASRQAPQYLIKSDKTEHVAIHKGTALRLVLTRARKSDRTKKAKKE